MSTDYNYDDQGQFFPFFILTIAGLITGPTTYFALRPSKDLESTAPRIKSDFRPKDDDLIERERRKQRRKERRLKRGITSIIGWIVMAWMVYLIIVTQRSIPKIWDPYDILGLSMSAEEKEIKSRYRKLSVTHHPDKRQVDASKNETVETINNEWVEITKAFKALTDEEVRNNYIQYGHPDGKQSFSIGIALPQFIVEEGSGKYVLLLYGTLLGVLLPFLVGKWWYGTQKMTREKILINSASQLFTEYREDLDEAQVVGVLSTGDEYADIDAGKTADEDAPRILSMLTENSGLDDRNIKVLEKMNDSGRQKVLGLIWAYLGRVELGDEKLNAQKYQVAPIAFALNESFSSMAPMFGNTQPLLSSYSTAQNLLQGIMPGASPLLQLPYMTNDAVVAIENFNAIKARSVQDFMGIPDAQRRKLLVESKLLTLEQYKAAVQVASQIPVARIEKAFFKVVGERHITPSSLVQFVVKLRLIPPSVQDVPPVEALDLEDVDPKEGDIDALHGRKKRKDADGNVIEEANVPVQAPLANAPYYARDHAPKWRVFLAEPKSGKIAVPPFTFTTFDKPIFNEDGSPTCNVQTLKMQFTAPPQSNKYPFVAHLVCDSYIGTDSKIPVVLDVQDASQAEEIEEEEEISEPEEDSIAGQMAALKEGGAAPKKRRTRKIVEVESDDESDTEGDDDSDSDTDTDTSSDEE